MKKLSINFIHFQMKIYQNLTNIQQILQTISSFLEFVILGTILTYL